MPKLRVFAALILIGFSLLALGVASLVDSSATASVAKSGIESP